MLRLVTIRPLIRKAGLNPLLLNRSYASKVEDPIKAPGSIQHTFTTNPNITSSKFHTNPKPVPSSTRLIERVKESIIKVPSPRSLKKHLDNYIIGQTTAKKVMSVAVYNHYLRINDKAKKLAKTLEVQRAKKDDEAYSLSDNIKPSNQTPEQIGFNIDELKDDDLELSKSNILLLGPSGSGKTLIAQTLAKTLNVPFSITDCTQLTQAGYIGEDVELCIQRLLINSGYDVEKAEKGIIVLDEVDKLSKPLMMNGTKDVAGEGVQQALLKLIEGTTVQVQVKKPVNRDHDTQGNHTLSKKTETYHVDTSNILFVLMGAFVGLDRHIARRVKHTKNKDKKEEEEEENKEDEHYKRHLIKQIKLEDGRKVSALELVTPQDLTSYGMIPELIGRVPIITGLDSLNENNLLSILKEPKNALLNQYRYIFEQFGVKLVITEPALVKISELALKEGTGARGLRGIMEKLLLTVNYECPESGVAYVLINKATVESISSGIIEANYYNASEGTMLIKDVAKEDLTLSQKLDISDDHSDDV